MSVVVVGSLLKDLLGSYYIHCDTLGQPRHFLKFLHNTFSEVDKTPTKLHSHMSVVCRPVRKLLYTLGYTSYFLALYYTPTCLLSVVVVPLGSYYTMMFLCGLE